LNPHSDLNNYQGSLQPKGFPSIPAGWVSDSETFPSHNGKAQLYSVLHHPEEWKTPRVLVVLHGLGEHGGRYLHFPHYTQSVVDAVYYYDHLGHGRSEGLRGHVDRFDDLVDDAALAILKLEERLRKQFGHAEIHLLGHSMGGLIALRTLFLHPSLPISSATISAPLLGIKVELPLVKRVAAHVLSRVWSTLHMTSELDANLLTHDKEVVQAYQVDRLVHSKGTPKFYTELQVAMADTLSRHEGIQHSVQMLIPMQDRIVDPEKAVSFFRSLKLRDKALKTYPTFFHEPFNEVGKEQVFEDLNSWIKSHSMSSSE
jgi:alpha-beta hydrolase superfamily lysophospholipase